MKKYSIHIIILLAGLLLGWAFFGGSSDKNADSTHEHATQNEMWTCSMHPQIMQPEPGSCPICGMDLIPADANADGLSAHQFKMTKNAMALANIETTTIGNSETSDKTITLSGKISVNENNNTVLTAHFKGRIERLYVNSLGEEIKRGQLIASVYSPELVTAQRELLTALDMRFSQPELYKAVRHKLKNWDVTDRQIEKIEQTKETMDDFPIYATAGGVVIEKMIEEGNHIVEGKGLFKVSNLKSLWAEFDVYESQISLFKKGQEIEITSNAYPDKKIKAKVSFIDPVLNPITRTVALRAVLSNANNELKPGMFVEGKVANTRSNNKNMLKVPSSAILWTGKRSVLYVKSGADEPFFEMREVSLGNRIGESYEVLSGISNGEEVVTNGAFTVDAAAQLQGKKSMMNKGGDKTMKGHHGHNMMVDKREAVSKQFQSQLKVVFDNYIALKDALVKDELKKSKSSAKDILVTIDKVDMKLITGDAHLQWMKLQKAIKKAAKLIANQSTIQEQRKDFIELSNSMIEAVQTFGVNQKVYQQFCPMADDNKGANWLSLENRILNPYFGNAMLNCGNIVTEIN